MMDGVALVSFSVRVIEFPDRSVRVRFSVRCRLKAVIPLYRVICPSHSVRGPLVDFIAWESFVR